MAPSNKACNEPFDPQWPEAPGRADWLYVPTDLKERTPHPALAPPEVIEIISKTYASPQEPVASLSTFTLFGQLAIELRLTIWRHSLPASRLVAILFDTPTHSYRSTSAPPTALSVNQESRLVALEHYELCFATYFSPAKIYFDFKVDELYLGVGNLPVHWDPATAFFSSLRPSELSRITSICMDHEIESLYTELDTEDDQDTLFYGLTNLQTLTVIAPTGDFDYMLAEVQKGGVEFQAWSIALDGVIMPWVLPFNRDATVGEANLSTHWANIECTKRDEQDFRLKTTRYVSRSRVKKETKWVERIEFLEGCIFEPETGCVFGEDQTLRSLLRWRDLGDGRYEQLTNELNFDRQGLEPIDPFVAYHVQHDCRCAARHMHFYTHFYALHFLHSEDLNDLDIVGSVLKIQLRTRD